MRRNLFRLLSFRTERLPAGRRVERNLLRLIIDSSSFRCGGTPRNDKTTLPCEARGRRNDKITCFVIQGIIRKKTEKITEL